MSKKARKNQGNKRSAGTYSVAFGRFKDAVALHKEALRQKSIKDTEIVARIVSAFRMTPPIKAATPISKILGGDANAWDLGLMLMAYPAFKNDGLVLQKGDVMNASTLGDIGDLVFAWYVSDGWTVIS
jgi:hypothetical protein